MTRLPHMPAHRQARIDYDLAVRLVTRDGTARVSFIQRHLAMGYNQAVALLQQLEARGIVGPPDRDGNREVFSRTTRPSCVVPVAARSLSSPSATAGSTMASKAATTTKGSATRSTTAKATTSSSKRATSAKPAKAEAAPAAAKTSAPVPDAIDPKVPAKSRRTGA